MNKLYRCPECGLHYQNQKIAKQCEAFCKEYNACNLEITQFSIETKKMRDKTI